MKEIKFQKKDSIKITAEVASYLDSLKDNKHYILTIKESKERRSLNANSYCWVLIDKLAAKLNIAKSIIYKEYIKEIGGVSEVFTVADEAVNKFCEIWSENGLGWQTDLLPSFIYGKTDVIAYYGSSTFDTAQMSRLIELVIQDCKENDIETMTPEELSRLCEEWR